MSCLVTPKDWDVFRTGHRTPSYTPLALEWDGDDLVPSLLGAATVRLLADSVGRYGQRDPHPPETRVDWEYQ